MVVTLISGIKLLEGTGAYGPLLLAPPEGIYSTVQYNTVQYSTVQYSTVQYSNRRGGWCQGVAHSIFHSVWCQCDRCC